MADLPKRFLAALGESIVRRITTLENQLDAYKCAECDDLVGLEDEFSQCNECYKLICDGCDDIAFPFFKNVCGNRADHFKCTECRKPEEICGMCGWKICNECRGQVKAWQTDVRCQAHSDCGSIFPLCADCRERGMSGRVNCSEYPPKKSLWVNKF